VLRIIAPADLAVAKLKLLNDINIDRQGVLCRNTADELLFPMNRTPSKLKAALWMAGFLSLMLLTAISGREAARELTVFQIMELRSTLGLLMICPVIYFAGGFKLLRTSRLPMHAARALLHYAGQYGWFVALTLIPLAQVVSIEFTMPIWTAILAASFLGERITIRKTAAIALGLIGVFVIVRPAAGETNPGQLIALAAAAALGATVVMMKSLTRTEAALTIVFWMMAVQAVAGALPTLHVWLWPSPHIWVWVVAVAFGGTFSHFCLARAMLYADATTVVPMDFLRVPLTAVAGWLIYGERVDVFTVLGATLILTGNLLNLKSPTPQPKPVEA
jgi:drug/metabolite transporter (DMT)-like permease